jgi:Ca-activated chloride channel homolog
MRNLLRSLRPTDHFNIVCFSGANWVWSPKGSLPATEANLKAGLDEILKMHGGGGTELMGGLEAAYAIPPVGKGVSRTVVIATDGYVGVEAKAFRFVRERLDQANLFAFGIGSSVNRGLIEGMARAGLGEPFVVLGPDKAEAQAAKLRKMIDRPVLTDIAVRYGEAGAYEVAPEKIPDLLAERPLLIYGKYTGSKATRIEISGRTGRGPWHHAVDLRPADARKENQALRALWARKWVEIMEDEFHLGGGKPVENAITDLGLFYNLLTPFTSFVAIDSEVVNRGGQADTVRQPLPMPEGVSNYAVGDKVKRMAMPARVRAAKEMDTPAASAPPPMPAPEMLAKPVADMDGRELGRVYQVDDYLKAGKVAKKSKQDTCAVGVKIEKAENAGDTQALRALVEQTVKALGCSPTGTTRLRITIDGSGKLVRVQVVSGDKSLGASLVKKLADKISATRAAGKNNATVEISITLN